MDDNPYQTPEKSGVLTKQGGLVHNWKERYFMVSDHVCKYFEHAGSQRAKVVVVARFAFPNKQGSFNLRDVREVKTVSSPSGTVLQVVTTGRTYSMRAATESELQDWCDFFRHATRCARSGR
eukprot:TRINITY_DN24371_c0_g1_i1.p1 TRINITY_DN24371_c0_g1~~TRINITY_DN24371_c0_g1_i1.p1  ORF type:complete len:132 (+),score=17.85 TRINITY_DN24371_c0_g1_i1:31-396(+)